MLVIVKAPTVNHLKSLLHTQQKKSQHFLYILAKPSAYFLGTIIL